MINEKIKEYENAILVACRGLEDILLEKNKEYNGCAFNDLPNGVSAILALDVRINDKIRRFINMGERDTEDTELDLAGYIILKKALKNLRKLNDK